MMEGQYVALFFYPVRGFRIQGIITYTLHVDVYVTEG